MSQPPNFNRLAGPYRWMERLTFGPFLALCRFTYFAKTAPSRHALILGDGDGRFTARLLRTDPHIHIDAVDASSSMLEAQIRRAGPNASRLRTHQTDARSWNPAITSTPDISTLEEKNSVRAGSERLPLRRCRAGSERLPRRRWDLVVTHFFLDCLTTEEIHSLATRLRPTLSPAAIWIVSEFAVPPNLYGRLVARPLIALLYRAFGLLTGLTVRTLPDHHAALRAAGFSLIARHPRLGGLLISELWSLTPSNPS